MSDSKATKVVAHPQDSPFRGAADMETTKNWRWHHPPILFPIFLLLLTAAYVLLKAPQ